MNNRMLNHSHLHRSLEHFNIQFLTPIKPKTPTPLPSPPAPAWVENRIQVSETLSPSESRCQINPEAAGVMNSTNVSSHGSFHEKKES